MLVPHFNLLCEIVIEPYRTYYNQWFVAGAASFFRSQYLKITYLPGTGYRYYQVLQNGAFFNLGDVSCFR
jgi:hypothetical protein